MQTESKPRIFRTDHDSSKNENWTRIDNRAVRDRSLRLSDLGLLALMLSRPDNWAFRATELATRTRDGETAVKSALKRLEAAGYVRRTRSRTKKGQWQTTVRVFEIPQLNRRFSGPGETTVD